MSKIHVYIKDPGKPPRSVHISNTLENLQKTVGGYIETVTLASDLVIICNEEGIINDLPYNCNVCGHMLFGTVIFCGAEGDEFGDVPYSYKKFKELFPELWRQ